MVYKSTIKMAILVQMQVVHMARVESTEVNQVLTNACFSTNDSLESSEVCHAERIQE